MDPQTQKYPEANRELMKQFNEGMLVFNYIGHNDPEVGFTGEGLFSRYEMDHLTNTRLLSHATTANSTQKTFQPERTYSSTPLPEP